jgi:hypothetical protein
MKQRLELKKKIRLSIMVTKFLMRLIVLIYLILELF